MLKVGWSCEAFSTCLRLCLSLSMCVVSTCLCITTCAGACAPGCSVHIEARGQHHCGVLLHCSLPYFLKQNFLLNLRLNNPSTRAVEQIPGILLSPFPQYWDYWQCITVPSFYGCTLKIKLRSSIHALGTRKKNRWMTHVEAGTFHSCHTLQNAATRLGSQKGKE